MIDENTYVDIVTSSQGHYLDWVWTGVQSWFPDLAFERRAATFFYILDRLMREGRLRLAKHGKFLEGSIDEQIRRFRDAFPSSDEEVDMGGAGVWFFTEACPGGAVWIFEDGTEVWT